jgi:hypothetical protein
LGGNKSLTTSNLMQLNRFNNLYSFQCRALAASAIQEIVPVLTNVRSLDLSGRQLSDDCVSLFAHNMPHLTKLIRRNSSNMYGLNWKNVCNMMGPKKINTEVRIQKQ